jgi:NAD(P)-dependent dehydrogenase (short-subunit alcohol dehydrogenase family)
MTHAGIKGRDMNVFIVGATGYIGSGVTRRVLNAGHRVTALARSEEPAARLPAGDVQVVRGAVEDPFAVEKGMEHADAAIYLALQSLRTRNLELVCAGAPPLQASLLLVNDARGKQAQLPRAVHGGRAIARIELCARCCADVC